MRAVPHPPARQTLSATEEKPIHHLMHAAAIAPPPDCLARPQVVDDMGWAAMGYHNPGAETRLFGAILC